MTLKPFIFVTPRGVEWLGLAESIKHAWQIVGGKPKKDGCFVAPTAVLFRDENGRDKHINQVTGIVPREGMRLGE